MNPTALLKIIAALAPLMGDKAVGAAMVAEIQSMFGAMQTAAQALVQINNRLTNIDQNQQIMMAFLKMPLSDDAVDRLMIGNYPELVNQAITLGETHADESSMGISQSRTGN